MAGFIGHFSQHAEYWLKCVRIWVRRGDAISKSWYSDMQMVLILCGAVYGVGRWRIKMSLLRRSWIHNMWCLWGNTSHTLFLIYVRIWYVHHSSLSLSLSPPSPVSLCDWSCKYFVLLKGKGSSAWRILNGYIVQIKARMHNHKSSWTKIFYLV